MSGRRRGGGHGGEFHLDERWMTSYADMITVLMCLFIVLYAMSTVDQNKFDKLKNSLATGFGVTNSKTIDTAEGIVVPKELVDKKGQGFTASTYASNTLQFAKELKNEITTALDRAHVDSKAEVTATKTGVTVGLVGSSTYFDGNAATLRPAAVRVLDALTPVLKRHPQLVTVEGHADPRGSPGAFGTDWNLAAARATSVLVYLVDHRAVPSAHISSVSYGSAHPVHASADAIERNRRVDIVVHAPLAPTPSATPSATSTPATGTAKTRAASSG